MKEEYVTSYTTGRVYRTKDVIRLVNMKQLLFYMKNGVEILDFYPGIDIKTGEDVLVFIVNKKDSRKVYKKWLETRYE